jgi:hypothetical protein
MYISYKLIPGSSSMKILPISANFFLSKQNYNYNQNNFKFFQLFQRLHNFESNFMFLGKWQNYLRHGDINSTFYNTKECAMSQRSVIMIRGHPFPSSILSFMWGFFLSSHTHLLMAMKSYMYLMQNPKASSSAYLLAMLPFSLVLFCTNPFRVFKYLSIKYIQCI